ncbi:MFS transporter [Kurthia sibirica]|uniref:MFS transporter n=1 Tax=Kurthia sibirica TaxID=202750 RepID=A0A2U3AR66_9BACL|nr:MFS transporter [Kurthia sibirica]PWI27027.1 MFS transporter [Kurthia sibirica]GEK35321.1 multidrug resistance protein 1 [Kurthia sibirica]
MGKLNPVIWLVLSNLLVVFLGIGLIVPVMPTIMREMNLDGQTMGYLVAAFSFTQLLISPFAGKWVDRFGRKKMIVIGMVIFGISELLFAMGHTVSLLYLARFIGGVSAAFTMPAITAYVADITTLKQRPKAMGYVSAAINTGFILGPGLGGFLAEVDTRLPFFTAAGLGFIGALFSLIYLKEPHKPSEANNKKPSEDTAITGWRTLAQPLYFIPFLIILIASFGLAAYETIYGLFLDHQFSFTVTDIAILLTISGVVGTIFQLFLFDGLTRKFGEIGLIRLCLLIAAIMMIFMITAKSFMWILTVTIIVFLTFDLIRPALTTYLSKIAGNDQGFVSGLNSTFTSIGNIIGPIVAGMLFDFQPHSPYVFSMVVLTISLVIACFWRTPKEFG